ncbi:zinc finger protein DHHC domain containing protein [Tritrichomonas foetus]|uniref:Palmitoyltransferase n=1 Tax=Tritrichomonas foetus TaxID=1144522 RepID=A0A1J4JLT0_9EUKA|nr:zinc finger protein DHHC domain containing protein [Tritrichomonas foetus]|eukprot:OHS98507.1 zinc finger protein DHHC domain containing protein [Tritrichomonas foetus]
MSKSSIYYSIRKSIGLMTILTIIVLIDPVFMYVCFKSIYQESECFPFYFSLFMSTGQSLSGIMTVLSTLITIFIDPGSIEYAISPIFSSPFYYLSPDNRRFLPKCPTCGLPRVPRTHHCSRTGKCYIKMDHFCSFFGIVVALRNHRPFIVTLTWLAINLILTITSSTFAIFYSENQFWCIAYLISCFSILILISHDISFQYEGIRHNVTHIERMQHDYSYNLGEEANLADFYGNAMFRRLIPKPGSITEYRWGKSEVKFKEVV